MATIANAAVLLSHLGWTGEPGGMQQWTTIAIFVATGLALWAIWARGDAAYAAAIAWGLVGVFVARRQDALLTNDHLVETSAIVGGSILALAIVIRMIKQLPGLPRFV